MYSNTKGCLLIGFCNIRMASTAQPWFEGLTSDYDITYSRLILASVSLIGMKGMTSNYDITLCLKPYKTMGSADNRQVLHSHSRNGPDCARVRCSRPPPALRGEYKLWTWYVLFHMQCI